MAFGSAIKKLREDAGISVEKLTAKIGVRASRWRKWEEKDFDPRDEDRVAIERYFGMDLVEISKLGSIKDFLRVPNSSRDEQTEKDGPTTMQILDRLSQAFMDQAAAFRAQAEMMKNIENKMARQDSQAIIDKKVNDLGSNLTYVLAAVKKISGRQDSGMKEILSGLSGLEAPKTDPSGDGRNKKDRTGEDERKRGMSPGRDS